MTFFLCTFIPEGKKICFSLSSIFYLKNTMQEKKNTNLYLLLTSFFLIIADQLTKFAVKGFPGSDSGGMFLGQTISVFGDFVQICFVENEGMAFGISFGAAKIFLSLFSVFAGIALLWYLIKIKNFSVWVRIGITLVFTGAVGNLIDRVFYGVIYGYAPLFYGKVVDFVQVDIPDVHFLFFDYTHFPVFNVADSCITTGVIFLLIFYKHIPSLNDVKQFGKLPESSGENILPESEEAETKENQDI